MAAIITLAPISVHDVKALNLPMPTINLSPTKSGPFTNCVNANINAGSVIASLTSGMVVNSGVMIGKRAICAIPRITPTKVPQTKSLSAMPCAAKSPCFAVLDRTNVATVAFIPI
eukprot:7529824-Ditylum_brightwellii.AAC.2